MVRKAVPQPEMTAYARALGRLARRDHSQAELVRVLVARGHSPAETDAAVTRLRAERYLDDAGFAERFARRRLQSHGLGQSRIRQGLRERGVDRQVAEKGLHMALRDVPEPEALDAAARRFWRSHGRDEPTLRVRKLWRFLLGRGFPTGLVNERLRALWPRWSDALEGLKPLPTEDEGS